MLLPLNSPKIRGARPPMTQRWIHPWLLQMTHMQFCVVLWHRLLSNMAPNAKTLWIIIRKGKMVLRFFHNNLFVINQNSQIIVPFEKFCKLEKLILLLFGGQVKRKFFFSKTDKCTLIGAPEFVSVSTPRLSCANAHNCWDRHRGGDDTLKLRLASWTQGNWGNTKI